LRILRARRPDTMWLPHARWSATGRHSYSAKDRDVVIETDVITAAQPFDGIEVSAAQVQFDYLALATPNFNPAPSPPSRGAIELDVPMRSQYFTEHERGWCSPATLCMLHAFWGIERSVEETARAVFDGAYNGTGNWAFNMAYSGALGLRGSVAYLRNLSHAEAFLAAGVPLGISYSWRGDELPGAPLKHSDGHLAVLRGLTDDGDCIMNDPAAAEIRVIYPRRAIESIWSRNKGVAFVVAPPERDLRALFV